LFNKEIVETERILQYAEESWGKWKGLAMHYIWENIFWKNKLKGVSWLQKLIRI